MPDIVSQTYYDIGRTGGMTPGADELAYWRGEAARNNWTPAETRNQMLKSASSMFEDATYGGTANKAFELLMPSMPQDELLGYLSRRYGDIGAFQSRTPTAEERSNAMSEGMGTSYGVGDPSLIRTNRHGAGLSNVRPTGFDTNYDPIANEYGIIPSEQTASPTGYRADITPEFDPSEPGGVFGSYYADFDPSGRMIGTPQFQSGQREGSWAQEHAREIQQAAMFAASMGSSMFLDPASLGELGINTALSASELATNQALADILASSSGDLAADAGMAGLEGLSEAALGELGINTGLTASELASNQTLADILASSSGDLAADAGMTGLEGLSDTSSFDALSGLSDATGGASDAVFDTATQAATEQFDPLREILQETATDTAAQTATDTAAQTATDTAAQTGAEDLGRLDSTFEFTDTGAQAATDTAAQTATDATGSLGELGINTDLSASDLALNQDIAEALRGADVLADGGNAIGGATGSTITAGGTAATGATLQQAQRAISLVRQVASVLGITEAAAESLLGAGGAALGAALGGLASRQSNIAPMGLQSLTPADPATATQRVQTGARGTGGRGSVDYFTRVPVGAPAPAPVGAPTVYGQTGTEYVSPEAARAAGDYNFTLYRPELENEFAAGGAIRDAVYGPDGTRYRSEEEARAQGVTDIIGDSRLQQLRSGFTMPSSSRLGEYAEGGAINQGLGYLRSSEDGMADRIDATIDNRRPAKLSGGEFVIPADVVSHLGNGNSDAGAKQLHEFMNRVRKARTGSPKQGREINPNKLMPK